MDEEDNKTVMVEITFDNQRKAEYELTFKSREVICDVDILESKLKLKSKEILYSTYQKFGNAREERREAYVKSRFSPRSQKNGFLTEGVEIFFGSSHNSWLLPEFFSDFYI
jgi:hypothetical protein